MGNYDFMMNFGGVNGCVDEMQRITTTIDVATTDLEQRADAAVQSWDGAARAQYTAEKKVWDDAILEMKRILGDMQNGLTAIRGNTLKTENNNTDGWTGAGKPAAY